MRVCSKPGCPNLTEGGRCLEHRRGADRARRAEGNPYSTIGHRRFRAAVLERDPVCTQHVWPDGEANECFAWSTVADHYPLSRVDLMAAGLDPNAPEHGRGLCKTHHDRATARHQPGGWHAAPGGR